MPHSSPLLQSASLAHLVARAWPARSRLCLARLAPCRRTRAAARASSALRATSRALLAALAACPARAACTHISTAQPSATIASLVSAAMVMPPRAMCVPRATSDWTRGQWRRHRRATPACAPMQGCTARRTPPSRRSSSAQATAASRTARAARRGVAARARRYHPRAVGEAPVAWAEDERLKGGVLRAVDPCIGAQAVVARLWRSHCCRIQSEVALGTHVA